MGNRLTSYTMTCYTLEIVLDCGRVITVEPKQYSIFDTFDEYIEFHSLDIRALVINNEGQLMKEVRCKSYKTLPWMTKGVPPSLATEEEILKNNIKFVGN